MRYKKETKAALIGLFAIITFLSLINFIKGKNLFSRGITLYAVYENVFGLEVSRPVVVNGFQVGKVEKISFHPNLLGSLIVQLKINSDFKFSKNTTALIVDTGMVTGPQIELKVSKEGPLVKNGDTINSKEKSSSLGSLLEKSVPIGDQLEKVLKNLDTTLKSINSIIQKESNQISVIFKGLNTNLDYLSKTLLSVTKAAKSTEEMFGSYKKIADGFTKENIKKIAFNMNSSLDLFQKTLKDINQGKGTLGLLIKDKKLYKELTEIFRETKLLAEDLRLYPKRYFHFSIFGKNQVPYKFNESNK